VEPVPTDVRQAALFAFDAREPDADVADLAHDWVTFVPEPGARHLEFRTAVRSIVVEVRDHGRDHLRLRVRIRPPEVVHVKVRHAERQQPHACTARPAWEVRGEGGGELAPVPRGLVSLVCTTEGAGGRRTQTAWVKL